MVWRSFIPVMVLLLAAACAGQQGEGSQIATAEQTPLEMGADPQVTICTTTEQEGCLEIDLVSVVHDPNNMHLARLTTPHLDENNVVIDEELRDWKALKAGEIIYGEVKAGNIRATEQKSFFVYIWNPEPILVRNGEGRIIGEKPIPTANMSSYELRHDGTVTHQQGLMELDPGPYMDKVDPEFHSLGTPRVFRVSAEGPVAAAQFPWEMFGRETFVLLCTTEGGTLHPPRMDGKTNGLQLSEQYLAAVRNIGYDYTLVPFVTARSAAN